LPSEISIDGYCLISFIHLILVESECSLDLIQLEFGFFVKCPLVFADQWMKFANWLLMMFLGLSAMLDLFDQLTSLLLDLLIGLFDLTTSSLLGLLTG